MLTGMSWDNRKNCEENSIIWNCCLERSYWVCFWLSFCLNCHLNLTNSGVLVLRDRGVNKVVSLDYRMVLCEDTNPFDPIWKKRQSGESTCYHIAPAFTAGPALCPYFPFSWCIFSSKTCFYATRVKTTWLAVAQVLGTLLFCSSAKPSSDISLEFLCPKTDYRAPSSDWIQQGHLCQPWEDLELSY